MMAGAGGAMRATGRRATAIRFQQFGEGQLNVELSPDFPAGAGGLFLGAGAQELDRRSGWHPR